MVSGKQRGGVFLFHLSSQSKFFYDSFIFVQAKKYEEKYVVILSRVYWHSESDTNKKSTHLKNGGTTTANQESPVRDHTSMIHSSKQPEMD